MDYAANPYDNYGAPPMGGDRMSSLGAKLDDVNWKAVDKVQCAWNYFQGNPVQRQQGEIVSWLQQHGVTIIGERVPAPIMEFTELTAPEAIMEAFAEQGFDRPTPIQAVSWPIVLSSRDLVGVAKTGSGKTLAFIIPALMHIHAQPPLRVGDGPIALVMAPTRELACQIEDETKKVTRKLPNVGTVCIYGGSSKIPQMRALRAGVHLCMATPGRLIDMLESRCTNLFRVTYLVLDEADRMLDMGFEPQIRKVCGQIRPDRQTLMFSATWPEEVRGLASSFMQDFVRIHVGNIDLFANPDVRQHIMVCQGHEKVSRTMDLIRRVGRCRILIFTKTKKMADQLTEMLRRDRYNAEAIHGDKPQQHRDRVVEAFRRFPEGILVATDVMSRGMDVKELDVVINFDFPACIEDYVHRIGRTGRAGREGDAYSFIVDEPPKVVADLKKILIKGHQPVPPELDNLAFGSGNSMPFRSRYGMSSTRNQYSAPPPRFPPNNLSLQQQALMPPQNNYSNGGGNGYSGAPPPNMYGERSRDPTFETRASGGDRKRRRSYSRSRSYSPDRKRSRHESDPRAR